MYAPNTKYPNLPSQNLEELKREGFTKIPVLGSEEVSEGLFIIKSHIDKLLGLGGKSCYSIIDPFFASSRRGENLRTRKELRVLSDEHSTRFLNLGGIQGLVNLFDGFGLADVTYGELLSEKRPEIYFRIVRPHFSSDVGSFHRDHWFNEIYIPNRAPLTNFKVWLALNCSPSSGLEFVARRADDARGYHVKETLGGPRPVGVGGDHSLSFLKPNIYSGEAYIFDPYILHRGAVNQGPTNRISVELSFFETLI